MLSAKHVDLALNMNLSYCILLSAFCLLIYWM